MRSSLNDSKLVRRAPYGLVLTLLMVHACTSSSVSPPAAAPVTPQDSGGETDDGSGSGSAEATGSVATNGATGTGSLVIPLVSNDPNCQSSTACPPANPSLTASTTNGVLTGTVNQQLTWTFQGVDLNSATRQVVVVVTQVPNLATMSPSGETSNLASTVTISWDPTLAQTGSLQVVLRDYDRCIVAAADNSVCVLNTYNPLFDAAPQTLHYEITNPGQAQLPLDSNGNVILPACPKASGGLGALFGFGSTSSTANSSGTCTPS